MNPAEFDRNTILISSTDKKINFRTTGSVIKFEGFLKVYEVQETDEDTKASEVKGRIDMKKLLEQNTYDLTSPVANAKFVLINEVEKASSGLRNSLLSIMILEGLNGRPINFNS